MDYKIHQIKKYNYAFSAKTGGIHKLQLWSETEKIADVIFVNDLIPLPNPQFTPRFNNIKLFFKQSEFQKIIHKLRHESSLGLIITKEDTVAITLKKIEGLADSQVVCASCDAELLAAKRQGILTAMERVIEFCGADVLPMYAPVTFHSSGDTFCGEYTSGTTGHAALDSLGQGHLCLFDVEKENRSLPFTPENAIRMEDQLLVIHEVIHTWFKGRNHNYRIQEPFCKIVSFILSDAAFGPDYCSFFSELPDDRPDVLLKYLCQRGLTVELTSAILTEVANTASEVGRALTDREFADVVSLVMGQNTIPDFQASGILP